MKTLLILGSALILVFAAVLTIIYVFEQWNKKQ